MTIGIHRAVGARGGDGGSGFVDGEAAARAQRGIGTHGRHKGACVLGVVVVGLQVNGIGRATGGGDGFIEHQVVRGAARIDGGQRDRAARAAQADNRATVGRGHALEGDGIHCQGAGVTHRNRTRRYRRERVHLRVERVVTGHCGGAVADIASRSYGELVGSHGNAGAALLDIAPPQVDVTRGSNGARVRAHATAVEDDVLAAAELHVAGHDGRTRADGDVPASQFHIAAVGVDGHAIGEADIACAGNGIHIQRAIAAADRLVDGDVVIRDQGQRAGA
ncbi:hypothetical protein D9M73_110840 [compost metagenome]